MLGRAAPAVRAVPEPLGVRREALGQPDVVPVGQRHGVAVPLVRRLVHERGGVDAARVERPGLRLQRVAHVRVVDDHPRGGERVGAEAFLLEGDHPREQPRAVAVGLLVGSMKDQIGILRPLREVVEDRCTSKRPIETVAR